MTPTIAKHDPQPDGTVIVHYNNGEDIAYSSQREATIECWLKLFPGTSREWLEEVLRQGD